MKKTLLLVLVLLLFLSCEKPKKVDLIVYNAHIYTLDESFSSVQSMAIIDGKIVDIGTDERILETYESTHKIDARKQFIYPGFIDAHAHFFGFGKSLQNADLKNTQSWEEVLEKLTVFSKTHKEGWLLGRGWDQNDWDVAMFPTKEKLDQLFPNRPVYLTRIDGHAAIVNQKALDIAGFDIHSKIKGGDFLHKNGKLTGVLIDNAKDKMASFIPEVDEKQIQQILTDAQEKCFEVGLTSIVDAGLDFTLVEQIEHLQKEGIIKMRLHIMLSDAEKNINYLIKKGKIKTDRLHVNGFKFYGDGALGSRGACLIEDYTDKPHHKGFMLSDISHFKQMAKILYENNFQMNTHAIGDSANRALLKVYAEVLKGKNDRRWRIEHAQVIHKDDFEYFGKYNIIPSVQPTHATSDMYWAEERLGKRVKYAYAYQDLLSQNGWIPLGTDFPIEEINPLLTFYAAAIRKDTKGFPMKGFQKENALTHEDALRGMTIWAAKGSFEENEKGSLEVGKVADFIILNQDLMSVHETKILQTKVISTWINGEQVYSAR